MVAALPAGDDPVDSGEVQVQGPEQRLGGDETHCRGNLAEIVESIRSATVLDTDAHPYIFWPRQSGGQPTQTPRAFCEDLVGVSRRREHDVEDPPDEVVRNSGVEQVAHRIHEDGPGRPPPLRNFQGVRMNGDPKSWPRGPLVPVDLIFRRSHRLETSGQRERVAVVTARGNAVASGCRIPGGFGPLDGTSVAHVPRVAAC